jgi:hypothetical protein
MQHDWHVIYWRLHCINERMQARIDARLKQEGDAFFDRLLSGGPSFYNGGVLLPVRDQEKFRHMFGEGV